MGHKFQPTPAVLVVSEAVIALPFHHTGTLLVNKPNSRVVISAISFLSAPGPLFYPPDSKAELSVDGGGVGRVEKDRDSPRSVFPYFLFPVGKTFQLPGSFYSLNLHLEESFTSKTSIVSLYYAIP